MSERADSTSGSSGILGKNFDSSQYLWLENAKYAWVLWFLFEKNSGILIALYRLGPFDECTSV